MCTYIRIDILCVHIDIYIYIHKCCDTAIVLLKYKYMNGATPQFATNSARVTADINPCALIQIYEKNIYECDYLNTSKEISICLKSILRAMLYFFILHCVHCALVRVIFSRNIGRFPQIPAEPKTFDAGTLVLVNRENYFTYKEKFVSY